MSLSLLPLPPRLRLNAPGDGAPLLGEAAVVPVWCVWLAGGIKALGPTWGSLGRRVLHPLRRGCARKSPLPWSGTLEGEKGR